jgi:hypothetical protein
MTTDDFAPALDDGLEPYRGLNAAMERAAAPDTGTDVEAVRERIEDWLHDGRWPEPYDLSHAIVRADWLAALIAAAEARGAAEAGVVNVFVVRRQAGYAAGVYDTFDAAATAVENYLSAFSVHEVVEPLYRVNPDGLMGWWRLYFRVRGGPMEEIEIVEHEVRTAPATDRTEAVQVVVVADEAAVEAWREQIKAAASDFQIDAVINDIVRTIAPTAGEVQQ